MRKFTSILLSGFRLEIYPIKPTLTRPPLCRPPQANCLLEHQHDLPLEMRERVCFFGQCTLEKNLRNVPFGKLNLPCLSLTSSTSATLLNKLIAFGGQPVSTANPTASANTENYIRKPTPTV